MNEFFAFIIVFIFILFLVILATVIAHWPEKYRIYEKTRYRAHRQGRNDPCPCGSGLKLKKCCNENTLEYIQERHLVPR